MNKLRKIFEQWLENQHDRDFVRNMNSLAESDLGMARDEMLTFMSNRPETRAQLVEMAARFGVSEAEIDEKRWRALELTKACGHCSETKVCQRFLHSDGPVSEADAFCPNAGTFREMSDGGKG
ncbi:MAG: DUF6455 family protein [Hoeflea sp.]|nr:DUF6455 family protein [Hoeflea sp.]